MSRDPAVAQPSSMRPGLPTPAGTEAFDLARKSGLSVTLSDWLVRRGIVDPDELSRFLEPKLSQLTPPDAMADRDAAAERIASAIQRGERICVYGDYDCDGITSAAILTGVIDALGGSVTPLLASRFDGGYGVSPAAVERIVETGAKLLVTCDCGSSDHDTLARVVARGMDVIVIDHHLVPDEPLPALAFLNPHRPECGFPYKGLASCGLVLSVGAAVRARLGRALDLRDWLDLVAIGTVADVAPLDGDNRALVRAGLRAIAEAKRPGVRALLELGRWDAAQPITGEDVAFRIAPKLNAPGRLGRPDLSLELLLAKTPEQARALAAEIEQLSGRRRAIQDKMLSEAVSEIESEGWTERPAIVLGREGWNHGIVGIVAGRLASRYQKPVIVAGFDAGHGRGSVRGPKGSRLHDALAQVSDTLLRFGGHQAAAGVELTFDRLGDLRQAFEKACGELSALAAPVDEADVDTVWLHSDDHPAQVVREIERLEPCGQGNPAPRIALEAEVLRAREVRGGHLKLELELGSRRMSGFGPAMGERATSLSGRVVLVGRLRRDAYRGGDAVEIRVEDLPG